MTTYNDRSGASDEEFQREVVERFEPLTMEERDSMTIWAETSSAQIRPGWMALYMRPEAPRSTENGQPYLIERADLAKLHALLDEAHTR